MSTNTIESIPSELLNTVRTFLPYEQRKNIKRLSKSSRNSINRGASKRQLQQESIEYYNNLYEDLKPRVENPKEYLWGYDGDEYNVTDRIVVGNTPSFPYKCFIVRNKFDEYSAFRVDYLDQYNFDVTLNVQAEVIAEVMYYLLFHCVYEDKSLLSKPAHIQLLTDTGLPIIVNVPLLRNLFMYTKDEFIQMIEEKSTIQLLPMETNEKLIDMYLSPDIKNQLMDETITYINIMKNVGFTLNYNDDYRRDYLANNAVLQSLSTENFVYAEFYRHEIDHSLKSIDRFFEFFPSLNEIQLMAAFLTIGNHFEPAILTAYVDFFCSDGPAAVILYKINKIFKNVVKFEATDPNNTLYVAKVLAFRLEQIKEYVLNRVINL